VLGKREGDDMRWKRDGEPEILNLNSVPMFSCLPIPYYTLIFEAI
jgi:hypothetical protein